MCFNQCNLLNIIFDQVVWLVPFGTARLVDFMKFAPKNTISLSTIRTISLKLSGTTVAERYRSFVCSQVCIWIKLNGSSVIVNEH